MYKRQPITPQPAATFPQQGVTRVFFVEEETPPAPRMSTEQEVPPDDAPTPRKPAPHSSD
ncbi:MAG: hypothetical protein KUG77_05640 [Nannocystaceae bacterium]|nr:hypothetical protein [Nannocystaceae bacterium]